MPLPILGTLSQVACHCEVPRAEPAEVLQFTATARVFARLSLCVQRCDLAAVGSWIGCARGLIADG